MFQSSHVQTKKSLHMLIKHRILCAGFSSRPHVLRKRKIYKNWKFMRLLVSKISKIPCVSGVGMTAGFSEPSSFFWPTLGVSVCACAENVIPIIQFFLCCLQEIFCTSYTFSYFLSRPSNTTFARPVSDHFNNFV